MASPHTTQWLRDQKGKATVMFAQQWLQSYLNGISGTVLTDE